MSDLFKTTNPWDANVQMLAQTQARRAELRAKFEKKDAELGVLEEKLARTIEVQKDLQASLDSLTDVMSDMLQRVEHEIEEISSAQSVISTPPKLDDRFYGKPLPECAVIVIREAGRALTEEEIVDGLRAGGVQIVSKMPQMNVRRSMARRPDILYTKNRKWAVIETPIEGDKLPMKRLVNNFTDVHAESTRSGIEAAKARGVAWGRSPSITPEKEHVLLQLRREGVQPTEISKAIGVSRTTVFNYLKEHGLSKKYEFNNQEQKNENN